MQIIGFNLVKISSERIEEVKGKIEINSNINIDAIKKESLDIAKDKDVLIFEFTFYVRYTPKVADIEFKGNLLLLVDPKKSKDILQNWKKKKRIEDDVRLPVFNAIFTKCNLKALQLEEDLNLPSHIPLPRIAPQEQKQYTG